LQQGVSGYQFFTYLMLHASANQSNAHGSSAAAVLNHYVQDIIFDHVPGTAQALPGHIAHCVSLLQNCDTKPYSFSCVSYRDQVLDRIEQLAAQLTAAAAAGQLPQLSCVSTAASNVHMAQQYAAAAARRPAAGSMDASQATGSIAAAYGLAGSALQFGSGMGADDFDDSPAAEGFMTQQQQQQLQGGEGYEAEDAGWDDERGLGAAGEENDDSRQHVLRLGSRMQTRTLLGNAGAQAHGIVRGEQAKVLQELAVPQDHAHFVAITVCSLCTYEWLLCKLLTSGDRRLRCLMRWPFMHAFLHHVRATHPGPGTAVHVLTRT
jgi:hypothetical protein